VNLHGCTNNRVAKLIVSHFWQQDSVSNAWHATHKL
jgi:hypothetical protein